MEKKAFKTESQGLGWTSVFLEALQGPMQKQTNKQNRTQQSHKPKVKEMKEAVETRNANHETTGLTESTGHCTLQ